MNQLHTNSDVVPNNSTIHLSERQLKYLALKAEGKTKAEAARLAGYGETTAPSVIESSPNLRKALVTAMEAKGLTTERLAEKLSNGLDAKKSYFSSFKGHIIEERQVDDNETQVKYVRTALEIRGDLQEKTVEVNLGLISIPTVKSDPLAWNTEITDDVSTQKP